ncbi:patatin-like phospholipase family protein [Streptomyces sp. NPDC097619]|uniref:patatin-like phospholipase family protein n=1 Tax=Streptomyces sp. NPDC097619 TaxID=3157228 RepID=UPI0033280606
MGGRTALVLGGGGLTGIGWECGILYGLAAAGTDLGTADLVVGTSAGSVVGAQLTSGLLTPAALYERQLVDPAGETAARLGAGVLARHGLALLRAGGPEEFRRRVGAAALAARTGPEDDRRRVLAARLVSREWPARRLLVTAVSADTGELRAFDGSDGAGLLDAVCASCAVPGVWPPATVDGARYIDGGIRSAANADLAAGYERVVVLAPMSLGAKHLTPPRAQVESLRAAGARVLLITPDKESRRAFGRNVLDPARRAPAARAGLAQAAAHAAEAAAVWSD